MWRKLGRSLMKIRYRIGPRIDPCATPRVVLVRTFIDIFYTPPPINYQVTRTIVSVTDVGTSGTGLL